MQNQNYYGIRFIGVESSLGILMHIAEILLMLMKD